MPKYYVLVYDAGMTLDRYRRLPLNPTRFVVVSFPRALKKAWLKIDDTGVVVEASESLQWASGLDIEKVEKWCRLRDLPVKQMHGNIKDIKPYL